jgi:hypothetical protein
MSGGSDASQRGTRGAWAVSVCIYVYVCVCVRERECVCNVISFINI